MSVYIAYNYGDRTRTVVADEIGQAGVERLTFSSYHSRHKLVGDDGDDDGEKVFDAVVLR
jgi:hypothetical protein